MSNTPRTIFMGTGDYAGVILRALIDGPYDIVAVFTRPDGKVGRTGGGRRVAPNAVRELAQKRALPLHQPEKLTEEQRQLFEQLQPDVVVVAAYGRIIPERFFATAQHGFMNTHPSMLPELRGPSPIQNALLQGKTKTGTTIMQMDAGMDTGDIILQETFPIDPDDTSGTLFPKLADHGAALLTKALPGWLDGTLPPQKQDDAQATLCQLIERSDGQVEWTQSAKEIYNRFRALMPWPGIFTYWQKDADKTLRIKLHGIRPSDAPMPAEALPGTTFRTEDGALAVTTGEGAVLVTQLQMEGKPARTAAEFLNGHQDFLGTTLR